MRAHKRLLQDKLAYAEYIGKEDKRQTLEALAEKGIGSIVRLCFTPAEYGAPLRLMGYFAAAQHITRTYFPEAQLQLVAAVHTNQAVNGVSARRAKDNARRIFNTAYSHPAFIRSKPERLALATDNEEPFSTIRSDRIFPMTRRLSVTSTLEASAKRRRGHYVPYVAGHVALHDTVDSVSRVHGSEEPDLGAKRIISIGAQSEKAFYAARMACREAAGFRTADMVETGQIFTKHILPPYIFSARKQSEPNLTNPRGVFLNLRQLDEIDPLMARFDNTLRDLAYLRNFIDHYVPDEEYPAELACTA